MAKWWAPNSHSRNSLSKRIIFIIKNLFKIRQTQQSWCANMPHNLSCIPKRRHRSTEKWISCQCDSIKCKIMASNQISMILCPLIHLQIKLALELFCVANQVVVIKQLLQGAVVYMKRFRILISSQPFPQSRNVLYFITVPNRRRVGQLDTSKHPGKCSSKRLIPTKVWTSCKR